MVQLVIIMTHGLQYQGVNATSFDRGSFQPSGDLGKLLDSTKLYPLAARMKDGRILADKDSHYDRNQITTIESHVEKYLTHEGKDFIEYLKEKGKEVRLDGIGSAELGDHTIAAIAKNEYMTLLLGNHDFDHRVSEMGKEYGLNDAEALEYVLTHEICHAAGIDKEVDNENLLHEYFESKASEYRGQLKAAQSKGDKVGMSAAAEPLKRYHRLAKVAESRAKMGEDVLKGREPVYKMTG